MTGRRTRLSWVTALTVLSLLFGAGTLNALAEGHGNGHGGGGSGNKVEHQDVQSDQHGQSSKQAEHHDQSVNPSHGNAHDDDQNDDHDQDADVKVTDEARPGKGCGDQNHEHARHDECHATNHDQDDDDSGS